MVFRDSWLKSHQNSALITGSPSHQDSQGQTDFVVSLWYEDIKVKDFDISAKVISNLAENINALPNQIAYTNKNYF